MQVTLANREFSQRRTGVLRGMIQLRKTCVIADPNDVARLKAEFAERSCVLLPKLMAPDLLDFVLPRIAQRPWHQKIHEGIGVEDILEDSLTVNLLHFIANAPNFLRAVGEITGCAGVTEFRGRVYRLIPNSGHYDSWHSDAADNRLIGMSVNLSPHLYSGGVLQLRKNSSKLMVVEIANTGLGDATLFRIAGTLEHQVTPVIGDFARSAFAGWFRSGSADFFTSEQIILTRDAH